jgi:hypothetical protein
MAEPASGTGYRGLKSIITGMSLGPLAAGPRFRFGFWLWFWLKDIDGRRVERVLDVSSIEPFDHLDAGAAVFGDLVYVCALHEAHANIGMAQAVGRARITLAIEFELRSLQQVVEHLDVVAEEDRIGPLWILYAPETKSLSVRPKTLRVI